MTSIFALFGQIYSRQVSFFRSSACLSQRFLIPDARFYLIQSRFPNRPADVDGNGFWFISRNCNAWPFRRYLRCLRNRFPGGPKAAAHTKGHQHHHHRPFLFLPWIHHLLLLLKKIL